MSATDTSATISHFDETAERLQDAIEQLTREMEYAKEQFQQIKGKLEEQQQQLELKKSTLMQSLMNVKTQEEALEILNTYAKLSEEKSIRRQIEKILKEISKTLFGEDSFEFRFIRKKMRNQQEVHIYKIQTRKGEEYQIPIDHTAGGERDIVDTLIRILVLKSFPEDKRTLILDEPMKNLSKDLQGDYFRFIAKLCEEFDIQLIMITHEQEYLEEIERSYEFSHDGNRTVINES